MAEAVRRTPESKRAGIAGPFFIGAPPRLCLEDHSFLFMLNWLRRVNSAALSAFFSASVRSFGFGGNLNDLYASQWSIICNWQFTVLTNGQNGPPQGTDTNAKGVYNKMAKALGLHKAMGDAR
jgi:hypothetical protein